jgi:hypothetical protein
VQGLLGHKISLHTTCKSRFQTVTATLCINTFSYLYGGAGVPPNGVGFDDVYILSLPSFTWIKYYPDKPGVGSPHGSLTCNMINGGSQMVVMGGTFPLSDDCDSPDVWGMHNLDLGRQNKDNATWYGYQKNLTSYVVPVDIIQKIGGSYVDIFSFYHAQNADIFTVVLGELHYWHQQHGRIEILLSILLAKQLLLSVQHPESSRQTHQVRHRLLYRFLLQARSLELLLEVEYS